jgi:hypothetical protein
MLLQKVFQTIFRVHRLVHAVGYGAHSNDNIPSRGYGLGVWTMENAKVMYSMSLSLGGCRALACGEQAWSELDNRIM